MEQMRVDLNADLGEGAGFDVQLIPLVSSASIACGFHAGNPHMMRASVELCLEHGVGIGAHPSFPDVWGFGRRDMHCTPQELEDYMLYQLGALGALCKAQGASLQHVKPHGALYNMACVDQHMAQSVVKGIVKYDPNLYLLAPVGSGLAKAAIDQGLPLACEVFADRAYNVDGTLVNRALPKAVLHDPQEVATRTVDMVLHKRVAAITGEEIQLQVDSICLHGDNPAAIELVQQLRAKLEQAGLQIRTFAT